LPAISALASEVAAFTNDRYLAGLWEGKLRDELLWEVDREPDEEEHHGMVGAIRRIKDGPPTWSWASINGPVKNEITNTGIRQYRVPRDYDPHFLRAHVGPENKLASFGAVKRAFILVSAMCHVYIGPKTFCKKKKKLSQSDSKSSSSSRKTGQGTVKSHSDVDEIDSDSGNDDNGLWDWKQFQTLDFPDSKYDWVSRPHIIACMGEYDSDYRGIQFAGKLEKEQLDPTNKYGHHEFLILRAVKPAATVYQRIGKASTSNGALKRLPIVEARGWSRQKITLV
jgi:hypothetical protein